MQTCVRGPLRLRPAAASATETMLEQVARMHPGGPAGARQKTAGRIYNGSAGPAGRGRGRRGPLRGRSVDGSGLPARSLPPARWATQKRVLRLGVLQITPAPFEILTRNLEGRLAMSGATHVRWPILNIVPRSQAAEVSVFRPFHATRQTGNVGPDLTRPEAGLVQHRSLYQV